MAISRTDEIKQLEPGLNAIFGMEYNRYPEQWKSLYDVESTNRAFEEEVIMAGFGNAPTKAEGAPVSYDDATEGYVVRYTPKAYALAFAITKEAIDDNLYVKYSKTLTQELARALRNTKEIKGAELFNTAFDTFLGGDGQPVLDTAHPLTKGGTFRNELQTAADLSEAALEQSFIDIQTQFVDEAGKKIMVKPRSLHIPPALQFVAERLLKSQYRPGTSDNDVNAMANMGMLPGGYSVNQYFTDPDAFFVKTDTTNGLKHFVREAVNQTMEGDFETDNLRYKARERYVFGISDPRALFGSPGAA